MLRDVYACTCTHVYGESALRSSYEARKSPKFFRHGFSSFIVEDILLLSAEKKKAKRQEREKKEKERTTSSLPIRINAGGVVYVHLKRNSDSK